MPAGGNGAGSAPDVDGAAAEAAEGGAEVAEAGGMSTGDGTVEAVAALAGGAGSAPLTVTIFGLSQVPVTR